MEDLNEYTLCMKQLECHWKIQATRFRYSGDPVLKSKFFEKFLHMAQARGHFFDLSKKEHPLVDYLLKH